MYKSLYVFFLTSFIVILFLGAKSNLTKNSLTDESKSKISHNGYEYGIITSPITGNQWLDRNLGATMICNKSRNHAKFSSDDEYISSQKACFGDYYQVGRLADGHQKEYSSTVDIQSNNISTSGINFITSSANYSYDWTNSDSDGSLRSVQWSKTDGTSICPIGFRVPNSKELYDETTDFEGIDNELTGAVKVKNNDTAFKSFLKLSVSGARYFYNGYVKNKGYYSLLWSNSLDGTKVKGLYYDSNNSYKNSYDRAYGFPIRCIKDKV